MVSVSLVRVERPKPYDLAWSGVSLLIFAGALVRAHLFPFVRMTCPFREHLGIPCASCGTTRAVTAFVSGDPIEAFLFNPLAAGLCLFSVGVIAYTVLVRLFGAPRLHVTLEGRAATAARIGVVAAILVNWAFLIAMGKVY